MMIRYWNPVRETETLSRQLDQLFDDFMGVSGTPSVTTWTPTVELIEKGDNLLLTSYLPGVSADDVDVQVTRESVLITGQRKREDLPEGDRMLHSDVRYGQFRRLIELPYEVQNGNVDASFEDGILNLILPKIEEEKNKVVKLSLGKSNSVADTSDSSAS